MAAGFALGAGSGDDKPVTACVSHATGAARLITSGRCARGETKLSWNQRGAVGPRGADGVQGAAGAPGAAGASGGSGGDGAKGERGSFSVDSFQGMPCVRNQVAGTLHMTYGSSGQVAFTCS